MDEYAVDGLTFVGDIEWSYESYSFDLTGVWKNAETGELYWADDSGCSCPSPFEWVRTKSDLINGTLAELQAHLAERSERDGQLTLDAANLIARLVL